MSAARTRTVCSFMVAQMPRSLRVDINSTKEVLVISKAKKQKAFVFGVLALFLPSALITLIRDWSRDDQ